jgi:PPP family 3-phenylpropionic acid transporter
MGVALAVMPAVGVLAPPLIGVLADALGVRGQLLRYGNALVVVSFVLLALFGAEVDASGLAAPLAPLLGILLLHSLARAPTLGIGEVLTLEAIADRPQIYATVRVLGSLGFFVAVLFVGRYCDPDHPTALPWFGAATHAVVVLVAFALPARAARLEGVRLRALAAAAPHARFFVAMGLWQLGNSAYDATYSLHVRSLGYGDDVAGILWGLAVLAEIVLMLFGSRVVAQASLRQLLYVGLGAAVVRWSTTAFVRDFVSLAALQLTHAATFAVTWLAVNARLSRMSSLGLGMMQGVLTASLALGNVVGMIGWSWLYAHLGARVVFAGAALAVGGAIVLVASRSDDGAPLTTS